jgi:hypothetical protein
MPALRRHAIDRPHPTPQQDRLYPETPSSWLMLVVTLSNVMLARIESPRKDFINLVETWLPRGFFDLDIPNVKIDLASIGQIDFVGRRENAILVNRVNRHFRISFELRSRS